MGQSLIPLSTATPVRAPGAAADTLARGWRRMVLLVVGGAALALGLLGVILPVLPTAPFLLLAIACFSRSAPRMNDRLYRLPLAGKYLRDWQEEGISSTMKWAALAALWVTVLVVLAAAAKTLLLKSVVLVAAVLASLHFFVMPVRRVRSVHKRR